MRKTLNPFLGSVLGLLIAQAAMAQFVAFNDYRAGSGTHSNATTYDAFGSGVGYGGQLKNITNGEYVAACVVVTNYGITSGDFVGVAASGTPAYNIFNGYVDFSAASIQMLRPSTGTNGVLAYVFTNLNVGHTYKFVGTAMRGGDSTYADRYTVFELAGAQSFVNAHSPGVLLGSTAGLTFSDIASNQCVIQTGVNTNGLCAGWDNIVPGTNGTFAVLCRTYTGTIPNGGSSAGTWGYGITGFRLEDGQVTYVPVTNRTSPKDLTVNESESATFSASFYGVPAPTYQWYRHEFTEDGWVNYVLPNETNSTFTVAHAPASDNGVKYLVVAQNTVTGQVYTATSAVAVMTVVADRIAPTVMSAYVSATNRIQLSFSEGLENVSATTKANYLITNAVTGQSIDISSAVTLSPSNVVLSIASLVIGEPYVLVLNNITDNSANKNPIAPGTAIPFYAIPVSAVGLGNAMPAATISMVGSNGINISGGGTGIGGTSDSGQFVYKQWSGDFDVQVRVDSMSLADPWAKAGLMVRPSTIAGNTPFAAVVASPNMLGCVFQSRVTDAASGSSAGFFPVNYPYTWLRLKRVNGTNFTGYASVDAVTWQLLGSVVIPTMTDPINLGYIVTGFGGKANYVQFRGLDNTASTNWVEYMELPTEPMGPSSRQTAFSISEIMYNPGKIPGVTNSLEYIEIYNSEAWPVNLDGYRFSGSIHYSFPSNTIMQAGSYLVVARDPAAVQDYYHINGVLGPWYANEESYLTGNTTNNNLPQSGTLRLRNAADAVLLEVNYESSNPWPIAADGTGHSLVLARPSYGVSDVRAWAASARMGGSPGQTDPIVVDPIANVVINEFMANSHTEPATEDYVELYNHGNNSVNLSGAWLSDIADTNKFRIPDGTVLGPRGFVVFTRSQLPFGLGTEGGRIFLVNSNQNKVIDVVDYGNQSAGVALGRYPDGAPSFRQLSALTPGAPNAPILLQDIVINEIMYSHPAGDDYQYVELYNKGPRVINLKNWKFTHGIDYTFTNDMMIAPNGYVVVANKKAALVAAYGLSDSIVVGDFGGKLSHAGERLTLTKPEPIVTLNKNGETVTNIIRVVENEVTFGDGGRWGNWSDGGGSSLELVDPRSDNQQAANWADSDETTKSTWRDFSITLTNGYYQALGTTNIGMPYNSSNWTNMNKLHIYLLDEGECLVDNVKVLIPSLNSNLLDTVQGSFDPGVVLSNVTGTLISANGGNFPPDFSTNWIAQGSYDQSTIDGIGGRDGGGCLHIRASTKGDPGPNKIRSPWFSSTARGIITIQGSARWLRGSPEIIFRTQGGFYEMVGNMQPPLNLGTPGAPNSRAVANAGPAIWDVVHAPVLPQADKPAVVTARAYDPDGFGLTLMYRINPGSNFVAVPMVDDGTAGDAVAGDGLYSATIPAQPSTTIVSFYIQGVDSLGATNLFPQDVFPKAGLQRCWPNDSPTRECVIRWGDYNMPGSFATYHLWMTTNSVQWWIDRDPRSNGEIDSTFVYGSSRVIYNVTSKSSGSPFHRDMQKVGPMGPARVDYDISIPGGELFLDDTAVSINIPGNAETGSGSVANGSTTDQSGIGESLAQILAERMMLPNGHRRYVHMFVNGDQRSTVSTLSGNFILADAVRPGGTFFKTWYPDDDGEIVKLDDWFEFNDASSENGPVHANASFVRRTINMNNIDMLETNKYRFQFQRRTSVGGSMNNWSNWMELINTFSPTLDDYAPVDVEALMKKADLFEWTREIAVRHTIGDFDSWGYDRGKNNFLYRPAKTGKYEFIPFDMDWSFGTGIGRAWNENIFQNNVSGSGNFDTGDPRAVALFTNVTARRMFLGAYKTLIQTAFNPEYLNPIIDQYAATFDQNGITYSSTVMNTTIKNYIQMRRDYIKTQYLDAVESPFAIATPDELSTTNQVTITGCAPVTLKTIKINGQEYPITWAANLTNWSITLFLNNPSNMLIIDPIGLNGQSMGATTRKVIVTNALPVLPGMVVFSEIMYNPANPKEAFLELYNRSSSYAFDLSGWQINGLGNYTFPAGSYILPGQYLVLARNRAAFAAAYGTSIRVSDVFDGKLDLDGETLTLVSPARTVYETEVIVDKVRYEARSPWAGLAPSTSLQLIDTEQDNARVGNWDSGAQWHFYSYTANAGSISEPSHQVLSLYPMSASGQPTDVYLDDIRLVLGSNAMEGVNLLKNGDFETGSDTFWNVKSTGSVATNTVKHGGNYSFHLVADGKNNNNATFGGLSQQITGFVQNTNYTVSYWYLSNFKGTNLAAQIGIGSLDLPFLGKNADLAAVACTPGATNSIAEAMPPFPSLWLNEVQPQNVSTLSNRFGQVAPWVEIYNGGSTNIDLTGYYLANNYTTNVTQWAFPAGTVINSGEYKLVWLDGAASSSIPSELHANFTIPASTGSVALIRHITLGLLDKPQVVDYLNYGFVGNNLAYGEWPDGQPFKRQVLHKVTPGAPNDAQPGVVKINEWMAANVASTPAVPWVGWPNPVGGTYDDWFELYNPSDYPVNLGGYYLTDSTNKPTQFHIPNGYIIQPHSFLMVWADNKQDSNTNARPELHVNFTLDKGGEQIALYDLNGTLLDLVEYGQQSENMSQGRYADGAASLYFMSAATPGTNNVWTQNNPPAFTTTTWDVMGTNGRSLYVTNTATDPDAGQTLIYYFLSGPANVRVGTTNGLVTWTIPPLLTPGLYTITVYVGDSGAPRGFATNTINVHVVSGGGGNTAPVLNPIANRTNTVGATISFTATAFDAEAPGQTLTFTLDPGYPAGASITTGGAFSWTPLAAGTNQITVRVTDSGSPALSSTATFTVVVLNPIAPRLTITQDATTVTLTWPKSATYRLHTRTDLGNGNRSADLTWDLYSGNITDDGTTCTAIVNKSGEGNLYFMLK